MASLAPAEEAAEPTGTELALGIMYPLIWWVGVMVNTSTSTKKVVSCQKTRMFQLNDYAEFFLEGPLLFYFFFIKR